jgi:hypothetical protein
MHNFMLAHDSGFAWSEQERGSFRTDFFPPVDFPVVVMKVTFSSFSVLLNKPVTTLTLTDT